jgi:pimeloyl-ACP methyl ester carboxylesterase
MRRFFFNANIYYEITHDLRDNTENVILFLHGFGGTNRHWDKTINRLSSDIVSILIDLPGHGYTPEILPDSVDQLIDKIWQFITNLKLTIKIHIVGHSLGAFIALGLAIRYPEYIDKIVLIATAANIMIHPILMQQVHSRTIDKAFIFRCLSKETSLEAKELVFNNLFLVRMSKNINLMDPMNISTDYISYLENLKHQVLILYGSEDKVVSPRRIRNLAYKLPNAIVKTIDCVGHYPHLEKPSATGVLINQFLNNELFFN